MSLRAYRTHWDGNHTWARLKAVIHWITKPPSGLTPAVSTPTKLGNNRSSAEANFSSAASLLSWHRALVKNYRTKEVPDKSGFSKAQSFSGVVVLIKCDGLDVGMDKKPFQMCAGPAICRPKTWCSSKN